MRFSALPKSALALVGFFLVAAFFAPLPYAVIKPGEGTDVLKKIINIKGAEVFPSTGKLLVMSVLVSSPGAPVFSGDVISSWIERDSIVLPREIIYPPKVNASTLNAQSATDMKVSQASATASAFDYLGIKASQGPKVSIALKDTGGPSGGLIFALGVIEKLTPEDLLRGRTVAGTGTIDGHGNVGSIGGINEKITAAQRSGASIFLAPLDNCDEIFNTPKELKIFGVSTLKEAVLLLQTGRAPHPYCAWHAIR